ncbi:MAG TPA: thioester reductase domain-containing protein, partial [Thermoanaerobaculia bacterium]|nr:thioester reductase domain-containing protein [Thermoanaerobaculia bacterium]
FYVITEARDWPAGEGPRRAGVSSFGMGGTNVHAVLEEAPEPEPAAPSRPWQLLVLSARSDAALDAATANLAGHLEDRDHDLADIADVASTLQVGRRAFTHRRILVCKDPDDALAALRSGDPRRLLSASPETARRPVVWMCSGLGEHYPGMGAGLYRSEPVYREAVDRCAEILQPHLGLDLRQELYTGDEPEATGGFDFKRLLGRGPAQTGRLAETWLAQPAVFVTGYALACLWKQWGVEPRGLIGYSLGEYLAASLAGVFSLEDALRVVAGRAKLIQELPAGAMLAVPLSEAEVTPLLGEDLSLAAINGPAFSVVAGPPEAVAALEERLAAEGKSCRRLTTTHAFHSRMMEPAAPKLAELLRGVELNAPEVPLVSNVTGTWMTPEEAVDPEYWTRHLLRPVRFGEGLAEIWREPSRLLLEVGPGQALTTLALQHPASAAAKAPVLRSLRHPSEQRPDLAMVLETLGRLWLSGASVDWQGFRGEERRRRVPLPTYPFERQRFFIEAARRQPVPAAADIPLAVQAPAKRELHARPNNLKTAYVEPRTPVERDIAGIWRDLLGLRDVGAYDSFFELGGNSLLAPRLVMALNDRYGIEVPVVALFEAPTVADMAEGLEQIQREGLAAVAAGRDLGPPDLRAEVALPDDVAADGLPLADWQRPRTIVLTGATGFLGGYLLRELLVHTEARIVCPVRAGSAEEAGARIRRNLEERRLWDPAWEARVEPLAADLGEPRWGLSEEAFMRLAGEADVLYHCGAWVNFTYPYKVLKVVNVLGTVEALRLASRVRLKPVHFISSIAAISAVVFAGGGVAYEDRELEHTSGLFGGYGETKWVAEQIVNLARERGIPVATYRPGVLSGDTWTGAGNTKDMIWNVLKGCIQLGIVPVSNDNIDVTPVDYVARAIVHLSRRPESLGHAFHLPQTAPLPWRDVAPIFQEYGYDVEGIPYAEWHRRVAERVPGQPDNAIFPFLSLMAAPAESEARLVELRSLAEATGSRELQELVAQGRGDAIGDERFDQTNTLAGLAGSGIACPPFDAGLLAKYLDSFVSIGWLQPAAELAVRAEGS